MKPFVLFALLFLAVVGQVTVAPLFPISGANPEFVLLALCLLTAFGGPVPVMVLTPLGAVMLGLLSDRGAGLLLLAYLPVLPIAGLLAGLGRPFNHTTRTFAMTIGAGIAFRVVMSAGAMVGGAPVQIGPLVSDVLLPGMFVDLVTLTVCYVPLRLAGWTGRGFQEQRGRYYASL